MFLTLRIVVLKSKHKSTKAQKHTMVDSMRVSTMTFVGRLETDVNIQDLYTMYVSKNIHKDLYIEDKSKKFTKKGKFMKSFGNQMTLKSYTKKYNIKLFYNKKFQITGIKSDEDIQCIMQAVRSVFNIDMIEPKMVMKNVTMKVSRNPYYHIHMYNLYRRLMLEYEVHYTPEIYPGIKLKYNMSTALVFATGSLIISAKNDDDIRELYDIIDNNLKLI